MKALLTALQEGRLVELPDNDKTDALRFLGAILEAVPEVADEEGITEKALQREAAHSTAIGKGWACPHATSKLSGELLCAVGWCPAGINYAAPDDRPVHLVVMYYVPDAQRHAYLKEISLLAKAINANEDLQRLQELTDLSEIRNALLDAITHAIDSVAPEALARMIQLEARHAAVKAEETRVLFPATMIEETIESATIISVPGLPAVVLSQNPQMVQILENAEHLAGELEKNGRTVCGEFSIIRHSTSHFAPNRILHECIVFKTMPQRQ
jgi:mannitol/fructose-specific phosphotransferase system IIA component (Ntr-type)